MSCLIFNILYHTTLFRSQSAEETLPMALSHVDQTGYPVALWMYVIKAATLGRSQELYAANESCLALLGIMGRFESPGCKAIYHILEPVTSRQPVNTYVPCLLRTLSASHVKVTAQLASRRGTTSIKVWRKPGIRFPLIGNSDGRWGEPRLPVPWDCWVCPVALPTVTYGAARSMLTTGTTVAKQMLMMPESTIPVAFGESACCWRVRLA